MRRIDTTDPTARWDWRCPECDSTSWRANDGTFRCYSCGATTTSLIEASTGEEFRRDEIEFVGPESSWKAPYATRSQTD